MLRFLLKAFKLSAIGTAGGALLCLLGLAGCQSKFIYFPRPYPPSLVKGWAKQPGHQVLDYQTRDGPQQAYLLSTSPKPEHLWIVCGGNGTVALDWEDWIRDHGPKNDAWLLIDMPGYGACAGSPSPWSIRRSLKAVVPAAMESLHWSLPADQGRLRFFGHSLGSAVCLMAAKEYDIRQGVLLSPFTSTMDMTREVIGLPLGFILWHRYDNVARLREIESAGGGRVVIVHGTDDEVIPVRMGRELAAAAPGAVRVIEVPGGRHNDLTEIAPQVVEKALESVDGDH
ncbi:MAG: alpha/beta hydrolase [Luteolibacter sp.]